ncbi:nicotinate-nucleotide adenylyltransferase [Tepidibacillus fermentans]|uniref:Probable nicotinate-nucleotide adenylyltransferase n=1 Tax=Tepidibacillus fermentans TaxID=1281767 RepID=A0A4V2UT19_9BACI|nr:nicotinate-nucleotide adenylyltransferase [Tepidibacillus fermentans]TCS83784.1 nicotinate-nucleotide adenylyltransferase [Tepidibacillus fermentans]
MKKVGILGGTFDPLHIVHFIMADQSLFYGGLDEIWFMPAYIPPHKQSRSITSADQRIEMVKRAIQNEPQYRLCTIELERNGPSYTLETIKELQSRYPDISFSFIIGGDMIQYLPKWYGIEELLSLIQFIGLPRPGYSLVPRTEREKQIIDQVKIIPMPQLEISSTLIRHWVKEGRPLRYLVPVAVEQYIKENHLYED